jgi:dihydrofolate reductase
VTSPTQTTSPASAEALGELTGNNGALVSGRRPFDIANSWNDAHPTGAARGIAGDKNVTIASANVIQQALELGLVDEVCVSLVPVLFGEGVPYFSKLDRGHVMLEDPAVVQGRRALHLRYPVRR